MKLTRRDGEGRTWPHYLLGGRLRSSTAGLMLAFIALFWVNQHYQPTPPVPAMDPAQQVVPPGFLPDPNYTWVPRTNVQTRQPEYRTTTTPRTTTPTTTTPTPTTTTLPESPTPTTTSPVGPVVPFGPSTTVVDPDGTGPLSPQTFTQAPPTAPSPSDGTPGPTPPTTQSRP